MKALRNPVVTGALVVIALGVVSYQVFQANRSMPVSAKGSSVPVNVQPPAPAPITPQPATLAEAVASAKTILNTNAIFLPAQSIDSNYAAAHLAEWADIPARDPFLLMPFVTDKAPEPVHVYPSPVATWKLRGIWRQTGGRVAAINNGIYTEGDSIEGFRIEKIEGDGVWFAGPERMERLSFEEPEKKSKPAPTNGNHKS